MKFLIPNLSPTYFMDDPLRDIFGVEIWLGDAKQVASRSATLVKTNLDKKG